VEILEAEAPDALDDGLGSPARVAAQDRPSQMPRDRLAAAGGRPVAVEVGLEDDPLGLRDRDRVEGVAPRAGAPDLARQALERDARALLGLDARRPDRIGALAVVEASEEAGEREAQECQGDEELREVHAGSVADDGARVNVQNS